MVDIILQQLPVYPTYVELGTSMISNLLTVLPLHEHGISQDANIHFNMVLMWRVSQP
jgi:hypothetical protein